jgi:Fe-S oxidoreductase
MCPSYVATHEEKDSTRGRSRVLQDVAAGHLALTDPAVDDALDLCLSCKGCARDCPTGVDMATYKSHVLHEKYAGKRRPRSHYALGRLPQWARMTPPRTANRMLRSKVVAAVMKRAAGIDPRRSLPQFSEQSLRRSATKAARSSRIPDVWLWADSFTDHFGAGIGETTLALLADAGLEARVIPEPACCALTWITTGQLDRARRILGTAIDTLHPYVASGAPVVGLEPSCLAALRGDAVELLPAQTRAAEVAAGMSTLAEYLGTLVRSGRWSPPDRTGLQVVVQPHCHHASVIGFDADLALLEATGATVQRLGGCCGLAGNFGMEQGHYETSVAIAEHTLLPAVREAGPDAVVLADGMSCRVQLDDLADVPTMHLAELFASRVTAG